MNTTKLELDRIEDGFVYMKCGCVGEQIAPNKARPIHDCPEHTPDWKNIHLFEPEARQQPPTEDS